MQLKRVSTWLNTASVAKWGAIAALGVLALSVLANPPIGGK